MLCDTEASWAAYDMARAMMKTDDDTSESKSDTESDGMEPVEMLASYEEQRHNQPTCTLFPKNCNATTASHGHTKQGQRLRRLLTWVSLDRQEYSLFVDVHEAKTKLQNSPVSLGDGVITEAVSLYGHLCKIIDERKKKQNISKKKNKQRLLIGCVYYTLKKFQNPSLGDIAAIVKCKKTQVALAVKQFRLLTRDVPEIQWIFEVERGQTNLFRLVSEYGLDKNAIGHITKKAKDYDLDLTNPVVVKNMIEKYIFHK